MTDEQFKNFVERQLFARPEESDTSLLARLLKIDVFVAFLLVNVADGNTPEVVASQFLRGAKFGRALAEIDALERMEAATS